MGLGVHRLDHRPRVIRINPPSFPNRRTSYFSESETRGRSDPVSEDHPDCDPWRPHIAAAGLRGSGYLRAGVRADLHSARGVWGRGVSAGTPRRLLPATERVREHHRAPGPSWWVSSLL